MSPMKNKRKFGGFGFSDLCNIFAKEEKDILKDMLPSFSGVLEVKHYVKGRLRVKIPAIKGSTQSAEFIEKALSPIRGMKSVSANAMLGTVLLKFDESILRPDVVITALSRCFNFDAAIKNRKSIIGNEFKLFRFALDQAVMKKTCGVLDIRSAMSLLLLFQLVKAILRWRRSTLGQQTQSKPPFPISLIWWLLQSIDNRLF